MQPMNEDLQGILMPGARDNPSLTQPKFFRKTNEF